MIPELEFFLHDRYAPIEGPPIVTLTADLVARGIIDPTKVVRVALENASSVASVLLLTEATLTVVPEEHKEDIAEVA